MINESTELTASTESGSSGCKNLLARLKPIGDIVAENIEVGKLYIWAMPHGDKRVVWKNKDGDGIAVYDDHHGEDHWYFDSGLVGELYGPLALSEAC